LQSLLDRVNQIPDFESKVQNYETQINDYKAKAEIKPFANEYIEKLNELTKGGATDEQIQAFTTLNRLDIDKMDAVQAKVLALQMQHGLTEREAMARVNRTYKLDPEQYSPEEIEDAKVDLKVDSKADKDYLSQHKAKVSENPAVAHKQQEQQRQQQAQQHIEKLKPLAQTVVQEAPAFFKGISLNGKEGDGAMLHDFIPSPQSLKDMNVSVQNYIQSMGTDLPATQQGKEIIASLAKNILIQTNYQNWVVEAASQARLKTMEEFHNPSSISRGTDNPNPGKTSKQQSQEQVAANY
jgi:hypothetical protein